MNVKFFIAGILGITLLFSCGPSKTKIESDISDIVKELKTAENLDAEKVSNLIELYNLYIEKFPNDEKVPKYMEMKAKYLGAINHYDLALNVYEEIFDKFPDYDKRSEALFMQAFINEVNLNNLDEAERLYNKYLELYPDGEFAKDATFSLRNLHLTPEQLMLLFEQANKTEEEVAEN